MNLKFWTLHFWKDLGYSLGSGPFLVKKLVKIADIKNAQIIIELGAGRWPVTREILKHKNPQTRLILIENNHESFLYLQSEFGQFAEVYEMSAAHLHSLLELNSVDIVISTLPLWSISHPGVAHILDSIRQVLRSGWRYIQYQYALQNLKDVKKYFTVDRIFFEPFNIWPAFIYKTHKK